MIEHSFLVVDPGKTCGICYWSPPGIYDVFTVTLDALPVLLEEMVLTGRSRFVVCEDFSLVGGNRRNDPKMPASQGIGMVKMACHAAQVPLLLLQPNAKSAGHFALDDHGTAAYGHCRNDHERDVVDLTGFVIRQEMLGELPELQRRLDDE